MEISRTPRIFWRTALWGLIPIFMYPGVIVISIIGIVTIPFAILMVISFLLLFFLAYVIGAMLARQFIAQKFKWNVQKRHYQFLIGGGAVGVLSMIPGLDFLTFMLITSFGWGVYVNVLFVMALTIISAGFILYRESMVKAETLNQLQQEKLIQADKMASGGILVSGVAHEINNPNNFMQLNSSNLETVWQELQPILDELAKEKGDFMVAEFPYSELKEEVGGLIGGITNGSKRIKTIVESLKDFARKDPGRMNERVDLNSVIASSLVILANLLKKSSDKVCVDYSEEAPCITGNRQQIEQVIINLLSNSCQALGDRSRASYVTTAYDATRSNAILTVRDVGGGIHPEDLKHIMDPFYTTKRDSGGTGLGLSISYTIINDHNGEITVSSTVGEGTEFTIVLPTQKEGVQA